MQPKYERLVRNAEKIFGVAYRDILGPYHYKFISPARYAVYYASKYKLGGSYRGIAKELGRHRTTISAGVLVAEAKMKQHPKYAERIKRLMEETV